MGHHRPISSVPNEGGLAGGPDIAPRNETESINAAEDETIQSYAISIGSWADFVLVEEASAAPDAGSVYFCSQQDWGVQVMVLQEL